jgi:predicted nucleic acid-binding Zn ribbon protein
MEKASTILGKTVRQMKRPRATLAWPSIVGAKVAAQTKPVRCADGILEISTTGKDWRNQLEQMQDAFRQKINESWGGNLVREVRFVAAKPGPRRMRYEDDNEHTPFIRSKGKR